MKKTGLFLLITILLISCYSSPDKELDQAKKYKEKINKYELKKYAEKENDLADKAYDDAAKVMTPKSSFNNGKAKKSLDTANSNYKTVYDKGITTLSDDESKKTKEEVNSANQIKANVAVKAAYDEALALYNQAIAARDSKDYEKSIDLFRDAKIKFEEVVKIAKEKKVKADDSLSSTLEDKNALEEDSKKVDESQDVKDDTQQ